MNIDATEIMVIAEMSLMNDGNSEKEPGELFDCVGEANNYETKFLCELETHLIMFELFGTTSCADWNQVRGVSK